MQGVPQLGVIPVQAATSLPAVTKPEQLPVSPFGWLNKAAKPANNPFNWFAKKPQGDQPRTPPPVDPMSAPIPALPRALPKPAQQSVLAAKPDPLPVQADEGLLQAAQQDGQINPYQGGQFNPRLHSIV